jgi:eukaryotic-like serine/threonine-protein kinase
VVHLHGSTLECEVEDLLGEGGQGSVYQVVFRPGGGTRFALKWYHPESATPEQWRALEALLDRGPPDARFLWPMELVTKPGTRAFGYLMQLRERRFRGMAEHMSRAITPRFRELARAGLELAHSFLQLHAKGLCYRDVSFGNVFIDPGSGEVLICDIDNVGIDGTNTSVLGTHYFMAPEILRGEAMPSTRTDRFSLAILLFYMLMLHHPLLGERELQVESLDGMELARLCGYEPVFIFDPHDPSNRPVPGSHDNALTFWPLYPKFIRHLFIRAFTDGLRDPLNGRVTEGQWRAALGRLRDLVFSCPYCGQQNFYDDASDQPLRCCNTSCHRELVPPLRLSLNGYEVVLADDTTLYPHHLSRRWHDYSVALARVSRHPRYDVVGLTNVSSGRWVLVTPTGEPRDVLPTQTVRLAPGTRIDFGAVEGTIEG